MILTLDWLRDWGPVGFLHMLLKKLLLWGSVFLLMPEYFAHLFCHIVFCLLEHLPHQCSPMFSKNGYSADESDDFDNSENSFDSNDCS